MPVKQVLYHGKGTGPLIGSADQRAAAEQAGVGYVPYFVSGPLSDSNWIGAVGALLHVACWITALVTDLILLGKFYGTDDDHQTMADKKGLAIWTAGFIVYVLALVVVLICCGIHIAGYYILPGKAYPFLLVFITGGALVSAVSSFLLVQMEPSTLHLYLNLTDKDEMKTFGNEFRTVSLFSLYMKIYVFSFLKANANWAIAV